MLNKITWLDGIGRTTRSKKNEKLENFLTDLQRLTIVHETDHGGSYYRFASGASSPKADEPDPKQNAKDSKTQGKEKDAKSSKFSGEGEGGKKKEKAQPAASSSSHPEPAQQDDANGGDDDVSSSETKKVEGE